MESELVLLQPPWHCFTLDEAGRRRCRIGSQRSWSWAPEPRAKETGTSSIPIATTVKELIGTLVAKGPRLPRKCGNVEASTVRGTVLGDVPVVREIHRS